jgi:hypothetical protein
MSYLKQRQNEADRRSSLVSKALPTRVSYATNLLILEDIYLNVIVVSILCLAIKNENLFIKNLSV